MSEKRAGHSPFEDCTVTLIAGDGK